ncbi:hypothetical protein F6U93_06030 [Tamlana haliotis]|uniref:Uncharacterized protein n=1 Tax=Pseudotamlana haliotis TaxID=2614804 RepID=A0A6N6MGV0_9FLAO|nr:hypothetical protein [Tamlana haliotis]KAB1068676.1 hypothetical protein F6U93_06030 [Tamlana haliotis]
MNLKTKLYLTLLLPFLFAGIGLYCFFKFLINDNIYMTTKEAIAASLFGLVFWFFEVRLIISMIEKNK